MRKIFLFFLTAVCLISLTNCGNTITNDEADSTASVDETEEESSTPIDIKEESSSPKTISARPIHSSKPNPTEKNNSSSVIKDESSAAPHEHFFSGWSTTKLPTCTEQGIQERSCTKCSVKETKSLEATGHNFGEWVTTAVPTCTGGGQQEHTCQTCGIKESMATDAAGHAWSGWQVTKEATTSTQGEQVRTCSVCGTRETSIIDVIVLSDSEKLAQARVIAQQIANSAPAGSDLDRVSYAAMMVSDYCSRATYTSEGRDYSTAYGVFIKGEYTCAGATRALGLVLECMGYQWEHVNPNQWTHQWCRLMMDGQMGYADGQVGWAGYGKHPVED